jgi:hypothetical protein
MEKRWALGLSSVQGSRIIPKKGLRKQHELGYEPLSYGKKRRLAEHSRRAKAMTAIGKTGPNRMPGAEIGHACPGFQAW